MSTHHLLLVVSIGRRLVREQGLAGALRERMPGDGQGRGHGLQGALWRRVRPQGTTTTTRPCILHSVLTRALVGVGSAGGAGRRGVPSARGPLHLLHGANHHAFLFAPQVS